MDEQVPFMIDNSVGEEVLPEDYGGLSKLVPIQDAVVTPVNH